MAAAAGQANASGDPDSTVKQEYRNFLFTFTNVLLHEMAHVFITYLTQGKDGTPDNMNPMHHGTRGMNQPSLTTGYKR